MRERKGEGGRGEKGEGRERRGRREGEKRGRRSVVPSSLGGSHASDGNTVLRIQSTQRRGGSVRMKQQLRGVSNHQ